MHANVLTPLLIYIRKICTTVYIRHGKRHATSFRVIKEYGQGYPLLYTSYFTSSNFREADTLALITKCKDTQYSMSYLWNKRRIINASVNTQFAKLYASNNTLNDLALQINTQKWQKSNYFLCNFILCYFKNSITIDEVRRVFFNL